jgi:hypothetical protein
MPDIRLPRGRGRPPVSRPSHDSGTPELVMKRLLGETAESLDLCLERSIITSGQHWCGIHLRWLYTLRYGAPGIRAIDPTHFGGIEISTDDPEWRKAREKEYHDAMKTVSDSGHAHLLISVCIHNERPKFLHMRTLKYHAKAMDGIIHLRDGLDVLVDHWER